MSSKFETRQTMKCPMCDGEKERREYPNGVLKPCDFCEGKGELKLVATKEETLNFASGKMDGCWAVYGPGAKAELLESKRRR